jgi:hypothetical protein
MSINGESSSVISWFNATEQMLHDVLEVIPYEPAHEDVWSPRLVTVILEACSQLDSLFKYQAKQSPYVVKDRLDITDYFEFFGEPLAPKWSVFWADIPLKLFPYESWRTAPVFKKTNYSGYELEWWKAYNKLKHNRIENRREGKVKWAVHSLAALLLGILHCECCRESVAASGWLFAPNPNPAANLDDYLNPAPDRFIAVETRLFTYPVGFWKHQVLPHHQWAGPASDRFRSWFAGYST